MAKVKEVGLWLSGYVTCYLATVYLPNMLEAARQKRHTKCEVCGNAISDGNRVSLKYEGERRHYFDSANCGQYWMNGRKKEKARAGP